MLIPADQGVLIALYAGEIGLLRAVGMTRSQLRSAIRWESVIIALQGAALGLAIGVFFGWALVKALNDKGITVFQHRDNLGTEITTGIGHTGRDHGKFDVQVRSSAHPSHCLDRVRDTKRGVPVEPWVRRWGRSPPGTYPPDRERSSAEGPVAA